MKTSKEQLTLEERKQLAYQEAMRYMENVEAILKKAGKKSEEYYRDQKYVHMATGTAYILAIKLMDLLFEFNSVTVAPLPPPQQSSPKDGKSRKKKPKPQRPRISDYFRAADELGENLGDPCLGEKLRTIYSQLHLYGYYDGTRDIAVIRHGLDVLYSVIEDYFRPDNPLPPLPMPPSNPFVGAMRQIVGVLWQVGGALKQFAAFLWPVPPAVRALSPSSPRYALTPARGYI